MNTTIREKDGGYQAIVSYKQGGKWRQKSKQGFKKQKDAKAWADEIRYTITEDIKDNIDTTSVTVKDALNIYLEYKKNKVKFAFRPCLSLFHHTGLEVIHFLIRSS